MFEAQRTVPVKREQTRPLRSKQCRDIPIDPGDVFKVYLKKGSAKRDRYLSARTVLSFDPAIWNVTLPDSRGRTMSSDIKEMIPEVPDEEFVALERETKDKMGDDIHCLVSGQNIGSAQWDDAEQEGVSRGTDWVPDFGGNYDD